MRGAILRGLRRYSTFYVFDIHSFDSGGDFDVSEDTQVVILRPPKKKLLSMVLASKLAEQGVKTALREGAHANDIMAEAIAMGGHATLVEMKSSMRPSVVQKVAIAMRQTLDV